MTFGGVRPELIRKPSHGRDIHDFIGIGLGPANLSLAALSGPVPSLHGLFLEQRSGVSWHPGLMFSGVELQVSFLKDLVSMVDPTSHYSFLNFLASQGRLYRFASLMHRAIPRAEFEQYYRWVAGQLPQVQFDAPVESVCLEGSGALAVQTASATYLARNVVVGVGRQPWLPPFVERPPGVNVFHSSEARGRLDSVRGLRVAVIGGGQSAAEIVEHLLSKDEAGPRTLTWVTSRHGLVPMDDGPFTNDAFNPRFVEEFVRLDSSARKKLNRDLLLASDGISDGLLRRIYGRMYDLDYLRDDTRQCAVSILSSHRVEACQGDSPAVLNLRDMLRGNVSLLRCDLVVWCTGYRSTFPPFLEGLGELLVRSEGSLTLDAGYKAAWSGPQGLGVYAQNMGEVSHGVADRNLSLNAWRSAVILNRIAGRTVYDTSRGDTTGTSPVVRLQRNNPEAATSGATYDHAG